MCRIAYRHPRTDVMFLLDKTSGKRIRRPWKEFDPVVALKGGRPIQASLLAAQSLIVPFRSIFELSILIVHNKDG